MASDKPFDGIDVTADEVQRIEKALKNEEFRKLFVEYAQEISDPENKRKYEEELAELERSRGMDVKFLHPKPGYVLKTSENGEKKVFINICKNENIVKPKGENSKRGGGKVGVEWTLPYSLAPGRDDVDHAGKRCVVYDCMFHPECFDLVSKDPRFRTLMDSTALDGIEREFKVKLDRNNVKKPKMKFKGRPQATILRTPNKDGPAGQNSLDALNIQYPYEKSKANGVPNGVANSNSATKISGNRNKVKGETSDKSPTVGEKEKPRTVAEKKNGFTKPKYSIVHRGHFDMQQFTNARDSMPSTRPQELIVKVELPLLKSAASVQLDIYEKRLFLECKKPVSYQLDMPLPYPVDEEKGSAKFDKSKACLIISLSVLPPEIPPLSSTLPDVSKEKPLVEEIVAEEETIHDTSLRTNGEVAMDTNGKRDVESKSKSKDDEHELKQEAEVKPAVKEEMPTEIAPCEMTSAINGGNITLPKESGMEQKSVDATEQSDDLKPYLSATHSNLNAISPASSGNSIQLAAQSARKADVCTVLPAYDFYQSDDNVTFIFRETNIDPESFKATITQGGQGMETTFIIKAIVEKGSSGDSPSEKMFSIVINWNEGQSVKEELKTDVSKTNAVVMLKKGAGSGNVWIGFQAGKSKDDLKEERFLTEESLEEVLDGALTEQAKTKETAPCSVTEFSADVVKTEFKVPTSNGTDVADKVARSKDSSQPKAKVSQKTAAESVIPALDLGPKAEREDDSPSNSDSQQSSPTSSIPPGLKSALRSPRRRAYKSVSFSEEVLVELFLEGPNRPKKGNKQKKKGRRAPFFGPRRMIEKLKDNSWESYSDSELLHRNGASTEEEDQDQDNEGAEWKWKPNQVLMRQSSSESESGPEVPSSPRTKGKGKSKGSRRRRKEKARREASLAANNGSENSDADKNGTNPKFSEDNNMDSHKKEEQNGEGDDNNVSSQQKTSGDTNDEENNNLKNENDEELPLEFQDHTTKCAFEFSNQVIYDLDE